MDKMYRDGSYERNNPSWHTEDSPWKAKQIARILQKNKLSPRSICEVGCGAGEILVELEKTFPSARFEGYEISPQAYALCEGKETANRKFHLTDLLDEKDAFFDVVLAIDVFEHIEDYLGFLKKLSGKGRYKVFHIPLDLSLQSLLRMNPILRARDNLGHLHFFCKETALASLRDCGYQIIDYAYTPSRLELPNQARSSNLARFPRQMFHLVDPDLCVRILGGYSLLVLAS